MKRYSNQQNKKRRSVERGQTASPFAVQLMKSVPPELKASYTQFAHEVVNARVLAERDASLLGEDVSQHLDFGRAAAVLQNEPRLVDYLRRRYPNLPKRTLDDIVDIGKSAASGKDHGSGPPTGGNVSRGMLGGTWAGSRNYPQGVPNARVLREWADNNPWIRSAVNQRRTEVSKADVAVMPRDDHRPWDKDAERQVDLLLEQPNEMKDSWRTLVEPTVEDLLVLDRGVWEKNLTRRGLPVGMYCQDGAAIKIYPAWSGDPTEPRYLYEEPGTNRHVDLLNDQAIVMAANPATYRFGLSPVQVLRDTIRADLEATHSAMNAVGMKVPPHLIHLLGASKTQVEFVRDTYEADIAGRRELFFIGGEGVDVHQLVYSARDNQWLEWQEYLARKIAIGFSMSPQRFGMTMQINKANGEVQADIDEDRGLIPLLLLLEEYLNRELLADYAPKLPMNRSDFRKLNLKVYFPQVSEIERIMHFETVLSVTAKAMPGLPVMTLNQALFALGERPVLGGNTFWVMTTQGPMPWLSYDNDLGALQEMIGEQDSGGGPGDSADDQSDDDGTGPQQEGGANPAETGDSGQLGSDGVSETTPSDQPMDTGSPSAPDTADASIERSYLPDGRLPGRRWSPSAAFLDGRRSSFDLPKPKTFADAARKIIDLRQKASPVEVRRPVQSSLEGRLREIYDRVASRDGGTKAVVQEDFQRSMTLGKSSGPSGHDGGMVALFVPDELARSIALPGGERPEDLHVTLAYLPDASSYGPTEKSRLLSIVGLIADRCPPLVGKLGGYGRFGGGTKDPVFMTVDVPGLNAVYERLQALLKGGGFNVAEDHGFTPHITLQYVDPNDPDPVDGSPEPRVVIFDSLTLALGDDRSSLPFPVLMGNSSG